MTIKPLAREWLQKNHPHLAREGFRSSKFFEKPNLWFFTLPCDFFARQGLLSMLLEKQDAPLDFYFLRVPFSFFGERQSDFDIRPDSEEFDLHLSANKNRWLTDTRGKGKVCFAEFLQNE